MEIINSYRTALDYKEILRILQKSSLEQENFIWQSSALGRSVLNILHYEIDFVAREVVAYFSPTELKIKDATPIFVKLEYRTSVFKVTNYRLGMDSLHFGFPKEIKTVELRSSERTTFTKEKTMGLKPSLSTGKDIGSEMDVRVFDCSLGGVGLLVSETNRQFFKNNRLLWITKFGSNSLSRPILGEVVYVKSDSESLKKPKLLKVGIKLSSLIPKDVYTEFIK